jgi:hypothetical protein
MSASVQLRSPIVAHRLASVESSSLFSFPFFSIVTRDLNCVDFGMGFRFLNARDAFNLTSLLLQLTTTCDLVVHKFARFCRANSRTLLSAV